MKLMIIDGNSIVNRAFYGVRPLNAPDGTPTNAVYGFLTIFQRIYDEQKPDAVCVSFDLKAPTFRHKKYDGYKGTAQADAGGACGADAAAEGSSRRYGHPPLRA